MARSVLRNDEGLRPDLSELIALRARVLAWPPARRGAADVAGAGVAAVRGRGMEYAESRPYTAGDDVRHVDWPLTARSGKLHTKTFQAEREKITLIVADTSAALYFGTRVRFKSVQAARAGAVAAWAAQRRGDRLGAVRGVAGEAPLAPQGGSRGVLRVLDALVRWYARAPEHDAGLGHALDVAASLLRPGACLVVLADAAALAGIEDGRLAVLARHHELRVIVLTDPLERQPPHARLPFALAAARIELDLDAARTRRRWRSLFADVQDAQVQRLRQLGGRACMLAGADDDDALFAALLEPRRFLI